MAGAFGKNALSSNTTGFDNAAFGQDALRSNSTGRYNSAFGEVAFRYNTTGAANSAFGHYALLSITTGSNRNVAVGYEAGSFLNTGSDNIYLANQGVAAESGVIKIGNIAHTSAFIEGIDGVTLGAGNAVYIDISNQLGTAVSSSLRTKTDVVDMGDASDVIEELRPVLYRYRADLVGESQAQVLRYGLIAEEVAAVAPHLVTYDDEGQPNSVQYRLLTPLLLNEVQEQRRTISEHERTNHEQQGTIETLLARVEQLEAREQPPGRASRAFSRPTAAGRLAVEPIQGLGQFPLAAPLRPPQGA